MSELSARDRALVGLGAALASNCIPCIEHHLPNARKAGLTDDEIQQALNLADTIRQVPARRVLTRATELLAVPAVAGEAPAACGVLDAKPVDQTLDAMATTMTKAASACSPADSAKKSGCC
ncbi:MAG: carboxymuconolactone decarboxylase family protein [Panacagrimonas sp.]